MDEGPKKGASPGTVVKSNTKEPPVECPDSGVMPVAYFTQDRASQTMDSSFPAAGLSLGFRAAGEYYARLAPGQDVIPPPTVLYGPPPNPDRFFWDSDEFAEWRKFRNVPPCTSPHVEQRARAWNYYKYCFDHDKVPNEWEDCSDVPESPPSDDSPGQGSSADPVILEGTGDNPPGTPSSESNSYFGKSSEEF